MCHWKILNNSLENTHSKVGYLAGVIKHRTCFSQNLDFCSEEHPWTALSNVSKEVLPFSTLRIERYSFTGHIEEDL